MADNFHAYVLDEAGVCYVADVADAEWLRSQILEMLRSQMFVLQMTPMKLKLPFAARVQITDAAALSLRCAVGESDTRRRCSMFVIAAPCRWR